MKTPVVIETHTRTARVLFPKRDLEKLLREIALARCGISDSDAVDVKIRFEDETAGSPPYKIGVSVTVDVVEDQLKLARPVVDQSGAE